MLKCGHVINETAVGWAGVSLWQVGKGTPAIWYTAEQTPRRHVFGWRVSKVRVACCLLCCSVCCSALKTQAFDSS
jgi:hypothetical protein